jgi:hypothetical protein
VLSEQYKIALEEARKEKQDLLDKLKESGAPPEDILQAERFLKAERVGPQKRDEIWNAAMAESWGKIDELEFETRWKEYVLSEI